MSPPRDAARAKRAAARRERVVVRIHRLGEAPVDRDPLRGAEAISLVQKLTLAAWSLSGRELPEHDRSSIPVRFVANNAK